MEQGDLERLGESMNAAQEAYEELLEPHLPALQAPQLRKAVRTLRSHHALGAKFSGAGGDGSVLGLFRTLDDASAAEAQLSQQGVATRVMELGPEIRWQD